MGPVIFLYGLALYTLTGCPAAIYMSALADFSGKVKHCP